jgi:hypothetical protein
MTTTIAGPSTDTQTVPRLLARLADAHDGSPWSAGHGRKPALMIDDVDGRSLKVKDVTVRDLLELAREALALLGELDPCGCKRCQQRHTLSEAATLSHS